MTSPAPMLDDAPEDLSEDLPPKLPETRAEVDRAIMLLGSCAKDALRGQPKRELEELIGVYPTADVAVLWKRTLKAYRDELADMGEPKEIAAGDESQRSGSARPEMGRLEPLALAFWLTRHHPELGGATRTIYEKIGEFANAGNHAPSRRELHLASGFCEGTIDTALQRLEREGWITRQARPARSSICLMLRGPWLGAETKAYRDELAGFLRSFPKRSP